MIFQDSWSDPSYSTLKKFFYDEYYEPLLNVLKEYSPIKNTGTSHLVEAIRSGRINFDGVQFTGSVNSRISADLKGFAEFDRRTKGWKPIKSIPLPITTALSARRFQNESMLKRLQIEIDRMEQRVKTLVENLDFNMQGSIFDIIESADRDIDDISVGLGFTPEQLSQLRKDYNENMRYWVQQWDEEQIVRLRDMTQRNMLAGMNREQLAQEIQAEWSVSDNKARFLARQETTLLSSAIQDRRYTDAGIVWYIWQGVADNRQVGNPAGEYPNPTTGHGNHYAMNGKVCKMSDPTVYADSIEDAKRGVWKPKSAIGADMRHPGIAFGCRCTRRPLVPGTY